MTAILGRVMLAFEGDVLPGRVVDRLAAAPAAGMTLFRHHNVRSPGQVRELVAAFQAAGAPWAPGGAAGGASPMLVAADQEGGQFLALGDGPTAFAGNMALGAVDDEGLTERVASVTGLEARAMGVNVVYAPCVDLATNPANPALGIRAFGDDPAAVARHGAAFVRGLQRAGVAAAVKHAPGMGDIGLDTHHGIAVTEAPRDALEAREFVPFRAAFGAGVRLAMSGHLALPALTGRRDVPSTLSRAVMSDLLRDELGFDGVTISDALDMGAVAGGRPDGVPDVVAAVQAGVDLLLAAADAEALARIESALVRAEAEAGVLDPAELAATDRRVAALRSWLGSHGELPSLEVIGTADHLALAAELARRSLTLFRDGAGLVARPVLGGPGRVLAIMPRPEDLTPADTSSLVAPSLAPALRGYHRDVDELVVPQRPEDAAIAAARSRIPDSADPYAAVVIGTIDGHRQREQLALVEAVADAARSTGTRVIAVAMRGPWDVAHYPADTTAVATYSILPGSLDALAAALAGQGDFPGHLPVALPVAAGR